ncbi:PEP-CTERM sorting domain-containing protein [Aeoliella mucimassa]|nr:PEP-CTERM sorting domain-containing protein [Aeoliella mucimassa]
MPTLATASEFTFHNENTLEPLVVLELSGTGPFDHSDVVSLEVTDLGATYFAGMVSGTYSGTFTSSSGEAIMDVPPFSLASSAFVDAFFASNDAPDSNSGNAGVFQLGFGSLNGAADFLYYDNLSSQTSIAGSWIGMSNVVPEPNSLLLLSAAGTCLALCYRRFR